MDGKYSPPTSTEASGRESQSDVGSPDDVNNLDALSDSTEGLDAKSSVSSTASFSSSATLEKDPSKSHSGRTLFQLPAKDSIIHVKDEILHVKQEIIAAIPSQDEIKTEVKKYYSDPINVAALIWYIVAIPALIIICLKSVGLLKVLIPNDSVRHDWEEVALHLMNALFLLATLALFPIMARHTYLLIRWLPRDKVELRRFYCRNGKRKPRDRTHIAIVVMWGHLTAWSVLATCIYYWATMQKERSYTVMMFLSCFSTAMSAGGILYLLISPLSQEFDIVKEGDDAMVKMFERRYGFYSEGNLVKEAQWDGGVMDCCKDWKVASWSFFCPVCVFGINMERLGFGNGVVHTFAFLVILLGPVMVFEIIVSMVHMGETAKQITAGCGLLLSVFGIAYGGLWRTKMRRRFHLPGTKLCCKSKSATDVCIWLWCCWCALCQETRTINQYAVQVNREMDSSAEAGDEEDYEAPADAVEEADEGDWNYVIPKTIPAAKAPSQPQAANEAPSPEKMSQ